MNKLILVLAILLLASIVGISAAAPDHIVTGHYSVSFDLRLPCSTYTVTADEPKISEWLDGEPKTDYNIKVQNNTNKLQMIIISLCEYNISSTFTDAELEEIVRRSTKDESNVFVAVRSIDGKRGGIASYEHRFPNGPINCYFANYYPLNNLQAVISSTFPWDEGTLQLLKTVHIEKIGVKP